MRLTKLILGAYGVFSSQELDLSHDGLHIVVGPNEAGKSTAMSGLIDLLYGIEANSSFDFGANKGKLRLGGVIASANGRSLEVQRLKRRKDSLVDASGSPLPDDVFKEFLGGIDRRTYASIYAIGHDELREGGAALCAGSGDLGESLFDASLGSVSLVSARRDLAAKATNLYTARGRTRAINTTVSQWKADQKRTDEAVLLPRKHQEARDLLALAESSRKDWQEKLDASRLRLKQLQRTREVLPGLARYHALDGSKEESLSQGRLVRRATPDELNLLLDNREQSRRSFNEACVEIERLQRQIDRQSDESEITSLESAIDELHGRTELVNQLQDHLPAKMARRDELARSTEIALRQLAFGLDASLGWARIEGAVLRKERIGALANQHAEIQLKLQSARDAVLERSDFLIDAKKSVDELGPPKDASAAKEALEQVLKVGDLPSRLAETRSIWESDLEAASASICALGLTADVTPMNVDRLQIPSERKLSALEQSLSELETQLDLEAKNRRLLNVSIREAVAELEKLKVSLHGVSEHELGRRRDTRSMLWSWIRQRWITGETTTPVELPEIAIFTEGLSGIQPDKLAGNSLAVLELYENSVFAVDEAADILLRNSTQLATMARLELTVESEKYRLAEAETRSGAIDADLAVVQHQFQQAWILCGIEPPHRSEGITIQRKLQKLTDGASILRETESKIRTWSQTMAELRSKLQHSITSSGFSFEDPASLESGASLESTASLESAVVRAQQIISDVDRHNRTVEAALALLSTAENEKGRAARALGHLEGELARWAHDWHELLGNLELTWQEKEPSEVMGLLERAVLALNQAEQLFELNKGTEFDQDAVSTFATEVIVVVELAEPELAAIARTSPKVAIECLSERLKSAMQLSAARTSLIDERGIQIARRDEFQKDLENTQRALDSLIAQENMDCLEDLESALDRTQRVKSINLQIGEQEQQLLAQGGGRTLAELADAASEVDADQIDITLEKLEREIDGIEHELATANTNVGTARNELSHMDGGDAGTDMSEEAALSLSAVVDQAMEYLEIQLAIVALDTAIDHYRQQNSHPLLSRASEIFSHLTKARFRFLRADLDGSGKPVFLAEREDGVSITVPEMSTGTADQLYLALRLATVELGLKDHESIPVVLDDLFVTFDDERSQAGLEVLAELCGLAQTVLFTHHDHLAELAVTTLGERCRIHRLERAPLDLLQDAFISMPSQSGIGPKSTDSPQLLF